MSNQAQNPKKKIYNLRERTGVFGQKMIQLARKASPDYVNRPILSQLIRSSTSIGANYCEADAAESKKDFQHKISICKKEAKETEHWLQMVSSANPEMKEQCRVLWKEVHELVLIFSKIIQNSKYKKRAKIAY